MPLRNPFRITPKSLVFLVVVVSIFAAWVYRDQSRRSAAFDRDRRIGQIIEAMAQRQPEGLNRGQWLCAVGWTCNLHGNGCLWAADSAEVNRFQNELEIRANGDVNLDTIYWIWDEYAKLTSAGKDYQKFRQTMQEELAGHN